MITILGRDIPNNLDELTIEQFENITELSANSTIDPVDKYLQIFGSLGLEESLFYDVDIADFIEFTQKFNDIPTIEYPTISQIELANYSYTAEMKLTVRDTKLIEKIAIAKPKGYISEILAIMFKRDDLTATEHYADAHLKLKAKMIKELNASIAMPYLLFIAKKISKQVEKAEDVTEVVE
jgi:hypothetical protein